MDTRSAERKGVRRDVVYAWVAAPPEKSDELASPHPPPRLRTGASYRIKWGALRGARCPLWVLAV
jgi:hypothetical protein